MICCFSEGFDWCSGPLLLSLVVGCSGAEPSQSEQSQSVDSVTSLTEKAFIIPGVQLWQNGQIPYQFDDDWPETIRTRAQHAIDNWNARTGLNLFERDGESDYLRLNFAYNTCDAPPGAGDGGVRTINISGSCTEGAIVHEIGHVVGLAHEQRRSDVDDFIYSDSSGSQWGDGVGETSGPFDVHSIMLSAWPGAYLLDGTPLSGRDGLSILDSRAVNILYDLSVPTVGIRGSNGRWLSSNNGQGAMTVDRTTLDPWEQFEINYRRDGTLDIKCNNGRYMSSEDGERTMRCDRKEVLAWERFTIERTLKNNLVVLKCNNGKFVRRSGSADALLCIGDDINNERVQFKIVDAG